MSTLYKFETQLSTGEKYEKELDAFYDHWYTIQNISKKAQRAGIDRVWTSRRSGFRYSVEYKSDITAASTEKVFIETISADTENKLGWAYTSCAQLLIYFIPPLKLAYQVNVLTMKHYLELWMDTYPKRYIQNEGYQTVGLLMPLEDFRRYCFKVDDLNYEPFLQF